MKVLDRYLTRELVIPILYCSGALVFLVLIADLFDNLDELLKNDTTFFVIAKYYLSLVPYAFSQTIAWAAWLGTMFLLVNFGFHNETTAMKAAGLKVTTIIKPLLFIGFLIGIGVFLINDRIVPVTYRTAYELREAYIDNDKPKAEETFTHNVTYFQGQDKLYFFRKFSKSTGEVWDAIILWLGSSEESQRKKIMAQKGTWTGSSWEFEGITDYQMDSRGRILGEPRTYVRRLYPDINFTPEDLATSTSDSPFLTYRELKDSINNLKENGVNTQSEIVDLQVRLASPWQALIMMLICIPFLLRTTNRKVIALNVLLCVGLAFVFHVSGAVGIALGKAGKLFPFLGAWIGNIIFGLGAILCFDRANY